MGLFGLPSRKEKRQARANQRKQKFSQLPKDEEGKPIYASSDNQPFAGGKNHPEGISQTSKTTKGMKKSRSDHDDDDVRKQKEQRGGNKEKVKQKQQKNDDEHQRQEVPLGQKRKRSASQHDDSDVSRPTKKCSLHQQKEAEKKRREEEEEGKNRDKMYLNNNKDENNQKKKLGGKAGKVKYKETGDDLLKRFQNKLQGSTFRLLNEQIYTTPNAFAGQLLKDPETFRDYHLGYQYQLSQWPFNPSELILECLQTDRRGRFPQCKEKHLSGYIPPNWVVVDMGCGSAHIAKVLKGKEESATSISAAASVAQPQHKLLLSTTQQQANKKEKQQKSIRRIFPNPIFSFDFCVPRGSEEFVTASDMANVPLENDSADIVIFCLSLMSTNFFVFIEEAWRILKKDKLLKIVEIRSRIPNPYQFVQFVEFLGFQCIWYGVMSDYFIAFDFICQDIFSPKFNKQRESVAEDGGEDEDFGGQNHDDEEEDQGGKKSSKKLGKGEIQKEEVKKRPRRYPTQEEELPFEPGSVLTPCYYKRR